jgi:hypothetical protein
MQFQIGDSVTYKQIKGRIAFICDPIADHISNKEGCVCIAIPPSNVRVVVTQSDYHLIKVYGKTNQSQ